MAMLKVKDVMTHKPFTINPKDTVQEAAVFMRDINCGVLPVGEPGHPKGIVTDRDIMTRVVAEGRNPAETHVGDIMTHTIHFCDEEDSLEQAAWKMRQHSVRRLLVTKGKEVTGIVNFTNLIRNKGSKEIAENVLEVLDNTKPSGKPVLVRMGTAGAGCEGYCDQFDDVL